MSASQLIPDSMLPVIQQAETDLVTAANELELARRAGLFNTPAGAQLQDLVKQVADAKQQLATIRQVYFPGQ